MSPLLLVEDVADELSDEYLPSKCIKLSRPQSVTLRAIAYVAVHVDDIVFTVICTTDSCWHSCILLRPVLVAGA